MLLNLYRAEEKKLALAYLYLSVENRINDSDFALFDEMCASADELKSAKGSVIGECEKYLTQEHLDKNRFALVSEVFAEFADNTPNTFLTWGFSGSDEASKRSILWMLVGLMYQSGGNFPNRYQLIETWVKKCQIDISIFVEMRDTSETLKAISGYKNFLETSRGMSYQEANTIMMELDKNIKDLQQSIGDLIAFA
jgi:hypothetical protein